jgi:hypothetical protein
MLKMILDHVRKVIFWLSIAMGVFNGLHGKGDTECDTIGVESHCYLVNYFVLGKKLTVF